MKTADIIARDRDDNPVLLVEIKAGVASRDAVERFVGWLRTEWGLVPFGMFVDLEKILVFGSFRESPGSPSLVLDSAEVLRRYDDEFRGRDEINRGSPGVLHDYLGTLVGAWLHDLDYRWKFREPPALKELTEIGLVGRLEGGSTLHEVPLALALR